MNIAYSTTVQWNPGDELILKGIRNLVSKKHTFIVYNRHPLHERIVGDNCYVHPYGSKLIDHVIFAGTPDWSSQDQNPLYLTIKDNDIDFSYIGVGGFVSPQGVLFEIGQEAAEKEVFTKAKARIVRDKEANQAIVNSVLAPCPSLFACQTETKPRKKKRKICFNLQGPGKICTPSDSTLYKIGFLAKSFKDNHGASIVCHTFNDFVLASELNLEPFYSSSYLDYFEYYDQFDLIVGPRIHGSGWGSTLGIPSITIPHDERADTAIHLGSELVDVDEVEGFYETLTDKWIKDKSEYLIELKDEWRKKYIEMLDYLQ